MHYSAFYVFVPVTFENMDEQQAFGVSNQASFKLSGYRCLLWRQLFHFLLIILLLGTSLFGVLE